MAPTVDASIVCLDSLRHNSHLRENLPSSRSDCGQEGGSPEHSDLLLNQSEDGVDFFVNDSRQYLEKYLGPKYSTLSESVVLTVVYCLIFLSGIFGNFCTGLVVLKRKYMRTSTNLYLCNLAVSDILTLLFGEYIA